MRRTLRLGIALSLAFAVIGSASDARAILVQYTFDGIVTTGTLSTQFNVVNLAGATFTATGQITSQVDLMPGDLNLGLFAATTTYDFGVLGSFTTNAGADSFMQFRGGLNNAAIQLGLVDRSNLPSSLNIGFRYQGFSLTAGDPNVPQAPGPQYLSQGPFGGTRTQTNAAGQTLVLGIPSHVAGPVNVVVQAVPEPAVLSLLVPAFAAAGWARRRAGR